MLEFVGPGVKNLSMDFRIGIDVMTTETACLSSIWETDEKVKDFYTIHGRPDDYKALMPEKVAYYDMAIRIDLSKIESMIALPFHPSNAYTIHELQQNPDILYEVEKAAKAQFGDKVDFKLRDKVVDGKIYVDQGIIAGCAGGMFENICEAAAILDGKSTGDGYFSLSVYPSSVPVNLALLRNGVQGKLLEAGAVFKPCFCGPCFGAGDVPANNGLSIRHTTRNFPNREGSKPGDGQLASVALVDSRSIAATAKNKGFLTSAEDMAEANIKHKYSFDKTIYQNRVYDSKGVAHPEVEIQFGPNIKDWPQIPALQQDIMLKVVSEIHDPVTTTDELIPSGETSSFRSNPLGLAEFTLSRKDPDYVPSAKAVRDFTDTVKAEFVDAANAFNSCPELAEYKGRATRAQVGSTIFAVKPGDGSAREQAASCQRVLGGAANIAIEYATKRYRSNLINWGMIPYLYKGNHEELPFAKGDYIFIPNALDSIKNKEASVKAYACNPATGKITSFELSTGDMTDDERQIILDGCLINYYKR